MREPVDDDGDDDEDDGDDDVDDNHYVDSVNPNWPRRLEG